LGTIPSLWALQAEQDVLETAFSSLNRRTGAVRPYAKLLGLQGMEVMRRSAIPNLVQIAIRAAVKAQPKYESLLGANAQLSSVVETA